MIRWILVAVVVAGLPGCITSRSGPTFDAPPLSGPVEAAAVDVYFEFTGRTLVDGVKDQAETFGGVTIFAAQVARELDELGVIRKIVDRPSPEALRLRVHVEDERSGPVGLRVASKATLRVLPAWENTDFVVRASGAYRGQAIEPFACRGGVTEIHHLVLIPLAPFMPATRRMDLSRDAAVALARHVAHAVTRLQKGGGGA